MNYLKEWWKYDKADVVSFIYWMRDKDELPPPGWEEDWPKIKEQLERKHPREQKT